MVNKTELQVGIFVWWSGRKQLNTWLTECWDLPCMITDVGDNSFRVTRLDNFAVSDPLEITITQNPLGEHGMRPCSPSEVERYIKYYSRLLEKKLACLSQRSTETQESIAETAHQIECYRARASDVLQVLAESQRLADSALP